MLQQPLRQAVGENARFSDSPRQVRDKRARARTYMFVLMDANARTGRKGKGELVSKECKGLDAYGRDTVKDSGE